MNKDDANNADGLKRRHLLTYATLGMGGLVGGAGLFGLGKAFGPSEDVLAEDVWAPRIELPKIEPGAAFVFKVGGLPLFVRRLTPSQIEDARSVNPEDLLDPLAKNPNLENTATATLQNRSLQFNGTYVVLDGRCPRLGCVPIADTGDYGGWFCPCGGAHFDVLGRVRKGPSPRNMFIPRYKVSEAGLLIGVGASDLSEKELDRILYP